MVQHHHQTDGFLCTICWYWEYVRLNLFTDAIGGEITCLKLRCSKFDILLPQLNCQHIVIMIDGMLCSVDVDEKATCTQPRYQFTCKRYMQYPIPYTEATEK